MRKAGRVILIVLDSAGIGALPDAELYGDSGVNTLKHLSERIAGFHLPEMNSLGLDILLGSREHPVSGAYGIMAGKSPGKDTTVGHWEMAGCVLDRPFPVYPDGFPAELINEFEIQSGVRVIGNIRASGTEIINQLGDEHVKTGFPIVYTSADSILQIAAHEKVISVERLYELCVIARKIMKGEHAVSRIVARPFLGENGSYFRTENRRDFSLEPVSETVLDRLKFSGIHVCGIGKIGDIFCGRGISEDIHTRSNEHGMEILLKVMKSLSEGMIFVNLVDFDMKYGHRRDPEGYYRALCNFDNFLKVLKDSLKNDDILFITADHGCDPYHTGTDHTREYVPLLVYGNVRKNLNLGVRNSFADLGCTALECLGIQADGFSGCSFAGSL